MKTNIKYYLLIITFFLLLTSCKQPYEEGPKYSLRSIEKRLEGKWVLDKYLIDGADRTDELKSADCDYFLNITRLTKGGRDETNKLEATICYKVNGALVRTIEEEFNGNYFNFKDSDNSMNFYSTEDVNNDNGPIGFIGCRLNSSGEEYCFPMSMFFKKLTNKELVLELSEAHIDFFNGREYRLELSKIKE